MCGRCGVKNPGENLNEYPWLVAIKETVLDQDFHHTGTLVSREWVVTAASILASDRPTARQNFLAKVGPKSFDSGTYRVSKKRMFFVQIVQLCTFCCLSCIIFAQF